MNSGEEASGRGTAVIVCGSPGAGKSTYGRMLARRRRAAFLDIDTCTEGLVRLALGLSGGDPDDRDSAYFKQHFREPIYETLFALARENLPHVDVVIAGPFTKEVREPAWPVKLRTMLDASVEVHYVRCDPALRRARLEARNNPRDRSKLADWEAALGYYGAEDPPAFEHVLIDTSEWDAGLLHFD